MLNEQILDTQAQELAESYTQALWHASENQKDSYQDLLLLKELLSNPSTKQTICDQYHLINNKQQLVNVLCRDMSFDIQIFLKLLTEKGHLSLLPFIISKYINKHIETYEQITATFITAKPCKPDLLENIKGMLEKKYKQTIIIKNVVQTTQLGGGILLVNNTKIDFSLKNTLQQLKGFLNSKHFINV